MARANLRPTLKRLALVYSAAVPFFAATGAGATTNERCLLEYVAGLPPSWSSDGTELVVDDEDSFGLRIVARSGESVREINSNVFWNDPAFSPTSPLIAFVNKQQPGLETFPADVPEPAPRQLVAGPVEAFSLPWSPDGKFLLYQREGALWVVEVSTKKTRLLLEKSSEIGIVSDARWTADGSEIVALRRPELLQIRLRDSKITQRLAVRSHSPVVGRDGTLWFIREETPQALVRSLDGRVDTVPDLSGQVTTFDLDVSTGAVVAAVKGAGLFRIDPRTLIATRMTDGATDGQPRWSPKGDAVAFVRHGAKGFTLCILETVADHP